MSRSNGASSLCGVAVAQEVPGRVDERVHRLGLAPGRAAAARARRRASSPRPRERRPALRLVVLDVGQHDRQLVVGHGHLAARLAVDDRDRAAPVALARKAPVAQAVRDRGPRRGRAPPATRRSRASPRAREARELRRVDQHLVLAVGGRRRLLRGLAVGRRDDRLDRQAVPLRERVVALVVGGHGHDRAGAVVDQHVVGDPDRDPCAVRRVRREPAGEDARLLLRGGALLGRAWLRRSWTYSRISSSFGEPGDQLARRAGAPARATKKVAPKIVSGRVVKTGTRRRARRSGRRSPRPRSGRSSCAASSGSRSGQSSARPCRRAARWRSR